MAKKEESKKNTRRKQFTAILAEKGCQLNRCAVMAWRFGSEGDQHAFHYGLMRQGVGYLIYDGFDRHAHVVFSGRVVPDGVAELAGELGGVEITPILDFFKKK